jgi:LPXTG-motif cell wall-anchored protein
MKIKTVKLSFILLSMCYLFITFSSYHAQAAGGEIIIEIKPDRILFNTEKLAPGRSVEEVLTIQNREKMDFTYDSKAHFLKGSKTLFNELQLSIWDSKKIVFEGKLSDFIGMGERKLDALHAEDLKFKVSMPTHLGNDFQGESCEFEITFSMKENIVNSDSGQNPDGEEEPDPSPSIPDKDFVKPQRPIAEDDLVKGPLKGQILPSTATNVYTMLLVGFLLILLGGAVLFSRWKIIRSKD